MRRDTVGVFLMAQVTKGGLKKWAIQLTQAFGMSPPHGMAPDWRMAWMSLGVAPWKNPRWLKKTPCRRIVEAKKRLDVSCTWWLTTHES